MSFEAGQEVVCIDNTLVEDRLKEGKIYTVADYTPTLIASAVRLVETGPYRYTDTRFRAVDARPSALLSTESPTLANNKQQDKAVDNDKASNTEDNMGKRYNTGKPQLSYNLLGRAVIEGEARVWEKGAEKYDRGNWLKGQSLVTAIDSVIRHATALLNGENIDPESGLPHCDHLVCASKIVSNSFHTRSDLDDRHNK